MSDDMQSALDRRDQPFYAELKLIGEAIGYGRAQQILGELWDAMLIAEYGVGCRGQMGVTVKDKRPGANKGKKRQADGSLR